MSNRKSLKDLKLEDAILAAEEAGVLEILAKIKHQKMSLEIEQLQLKSTLRLLEKQRYNDLNGQNEASSSEDVQADFDEKVQLQPNKTQPELNLLDEAKSLINTKTLDLSIMEDFNNMVSNSCENEDEVDDDDDDDYDYDYDNERL